MSTSSRATSSRSMRSECPGRVHRAVGKVRLHQAHRMPSGLERKSPGGVSRQERHRERHRRVLRARNPWGRCAGQWGRCACSAPSGPNAEWRQKKEWGHHDEDVVEGNVPAFRALGTCMRGCACSATSAQNVRGKVWGKVGKMRARCTKPGECPVVSKKRRTHPGHANHSCPTPVDKATIGHCGKTQRMALAADGGWAEGREMVGKQGLPW
ncbi:hypothetical protein B0H19DRAFT_1172988 [Mycena capillaripes]|nr:hypothetical protein B0H19DRAFT_1172988 [Mycena capillaripes]